MHQASECWNRAESRRHSTRLHASQRCRTSSDLRDRICIRVLQIDFSGELCRSTWRAAHRLWPEAPSNRARALHATIPDGSNRQEVSRARLERRAGNLSNDFYQEPTARMLRGWIQYGRGSSAVVSGQSEPAVAQTVTDRFGKPISGATELPTGADSTVLSSFSKITRKPRDFSDCLFITEAFVVGQTRRIELSPATSLRVARYCGALCGLWHDTCSLPAPSSTYADPPGESSDTWMLRIDFQARRRPKAGATGR